MELVRWEPFEGLSRLHNRINDLFDGHVGQAARFAIRDCRCMATAGGHSRKQGRLSDSR